MTLLAKITSTCFLHNIKKLEVYYFSLACNIKYARPDDATKFKSSMGTLVVQELVLCTGTRLTARTGTRNRFSVRFFDK